MGAHENANRSAASVRQRAYAMRLAVMRLDAALLEQARLGDAYARSVGTSAEQSSHMRLMAASLNVSSCDQAVKAGSTTGG